MEPLLAYRRSTVQYEGIELQTFILDRIEENSRAAHFSVDKIVDPMYISAEEKGPGRRLLRSSLKNLNQNQTQDQPIGCCARYGLIKSLE